MNLNSENNQIKEMNKTSFHKRVFSGISSPISSVTKTNENIILSNSFLNNKKKFIQIEFPHIEILKNQKEKLLLL